MNGNMQRYGTGIEELLNILAEVSAGADDKGLFRNLLKGNKRMIIALLKVPAKPMSGRNSQQYLFMPDFMVEKIRITGIGAKTEICLSMTQKLFDLIGVYFPDLDINIRILLTKSRQKIGEGNEGFGLGDCQCEAAMFFRV